MKRDYSLEFFPPALVVPLKVSSLLPVAGEAVDALGKIDTGADRSIIPETMRRRLQLQPTGVCHCRGASDLSPLTRPTFFVTVSVADNFTCDLEVLSPNRSDVLLGRDVLNQLTLHADGPSLYFELGQSSARQA